jgi:hypothetical protein
MITFRSWAVYGMLAAIWGALLGWQAAEHIRVSKRLHDTLSEATPNRASAPNSCVRAGLPAA